VDNRRAVHIDRRRRTDPSEPRVILADMSLLPDPTELYAIADRIARHASAARARAAMLGAAVATVDLRGAAADAFAAEAYPVIAALRAAAGRLDDAADALRRHAGNVHTLLDELALLGRGGMQALEGLGLDPATLLAGGRRIFAAGRSLLGDALGSVGL
jgi:hypothetical protein